MDIIDIGAIVARIKTQAVDENIRLTQHAEQEMIEDNICLDELLKAIKTSVVLENYPEHRRGSCCLVMGNGFNNRPVHIVCTTAQPVLIIITVYEPKPPKWVTPMQRRP